MTRITNKRPLSKLAVEEDCVVTILGYSQYASEAKISKEQASPKQLGPLK